MKQHQQIQSQSSTSTPSTKETHHKTEDKNNQKNTITFAYIIDAEIHKESKGVKSINALMIDRKLQQVYTASISLKQSPSLLTLATMIGTYIPIDHSIIKKISNLTYEQMKPAQRKLLKTALRDIVIANENVFINVYNNGRSLTVKLHSLSLLPKFGTKKNIRNNRCKAIQTIHHIQRYRTKSTTGKRSGIIHSGKDTSRNRKSRREIQNTATIWNHTKINRRKYRSKSKCRSKNRGGTEQQRQRKTKSRHKTVTLPLSTLQNGINKVTQP